MSSDRSPCSADIKRIGAAVGAAATGVARVEQVDADAWERFVRWRESGCAADMEYLCRYDDVRRNPALLLEGARSIIVCAFSYVPDRVQPSGAPRFASYALGRDYHEVVKERMRLLAVTLTAEYGENACRICVDTAPLLERYWAVRCGIGIQGVNGQLIVPGCGSMCVIGSLVTTLDIEPDTPASGHCARCGRCVRACPGKALKGDGTVDARKCQSYLTIEYRGDSLPDDVELADRVYGCDICQDVCPHNRNLKPTEIEEFKPREALLALDRERIDTMTQEEFSRIFSHSAVKRAKLAGLKRNNGHHRNG